MDNLTLVQWCSTVVAIIGALLTAMDSRRARFLGFIFYMVSNCLMIWWSRSTGNYGILTCQVFFSGASILGLLSNRNKEAHRLG